mmetsp:Transcript_18710/g.53636  ORF Transcript_18710/g.53636 Transcript_18710/m.53636 type:complete len:148 (-) Transcript_18710:234-677(-)
MTDFVDDLSKSMKMRTPDTHHNLAPLWVLFPDRPSVCYAGTPTPTPTPTPTSARDDGRGGRTSAVLALALAGGGSIDAVLDLAKRRHDGERDSRPHDDGIAGEEGGVKEWERADIIRTINVSIGSRGAMSVEASDALLLFCRPLPSR